MAEGNFESLLMAARRGEEAAWTAIYGELAPSLLGYLRAQAAPEPEDLLGEVFLQMVRDIRSFDGDREQFRAWAFSIAHHRVLDDRRYRGRRPVEPVSPEDFETDRRVSWAPDDESTVPMDPRIGPALRRLPAPQRDVVLMRVLGDLSVDQVARALSRTPGAVKALQRRAFETLKRELSKLTVTL